MVMSRIWTGMIFISILCGILTGQGTALGAAAMEGAQAGISLGLSMAGHAGAGKKGSDIVCAAASMLACTAGESARQLYRQGALAQDPAVCLAPGYARVEVWPNPDSREAANQLFSVLSTGFSLLAAQYPDHVKLEMGRKRKESFYDGKS